MPEVSLYIGYGSPAVCMMFNTQSITRAIIRPIRAQIGFTPHDASLQVWIKKHEGGRDEDERREMVNIREAEFTTVAQRCGALY